MKVFDIKVYDNFDAVFYLALCKTRREMLRENKKKSPEEDFPKAQAIFSPMKYLTHNDFPGEFSSPVFGTMYLNLETLSDGIIAHECGHAAFAFERRIRRYTGNFDYSNNDGEFYANGGGEEEEVFCYFLEFAFTKVKQAIRQYLKDKKKWLRHTTVTAAAAVPR
jgi:hypothetical protein